jgi:hypothetical protein
MMPSPQVKAAHSAAPCRSARSGDGQFATTPRPQLGLHTRPRGHRHDQRPRRPRRPPARPRRGHRPGRRCPGRSRRRLGRPPAGAGRSWACRLGGGHPRRWAGVSARRPNLCRGRRPQAVLGSQIQGSSAVRVKRSGEVVPAGSHAAGRRAGRASAAVSAVGGAVWNPAGSGGWVAYRSKRSSCSCSGGSPAPCNDRRTAVISPGGPHM